MVVVVLLGVIWAAVLVPPAVRSHAARRNAFLISFGTSPVPEPPVPRRVQSYRIQRRRRIMGGLATATLGTGLVGLLPTFRVFLVVHLFLVNSVLAYACLLAYTASRARPAVAPVAAAEVEPADLEAPEIEPFRGLTVRRRPGLPRPEPLQSALIG